MLRRKRMRHQTFQRLIVRRQWTIIQSAGDPDPAHAVRMHNERFIASYGIIALRIFRRLVIRWFLLREVRSVMAGPFLLVGIPPHQRFALAPWLAIGTRRRSVVQNPSITRPCVAPPVSVATLGFALTSFIFIRRGHHA